MNAHEHADSTGAAAPIGISAHFVNNVLAAAASYIDDDPEYARDVLAELGQFLSYRLRDDAGAVSTSQELAHTATYLRLQQARFPDRITFQLPEADALPALRIAPATIQGPVAEVLGRRLRERRGACGLSLRPAQGGLALELDGDGGESPEHLVIPLTTPEGVTA